MKAKEIKKHLEANNINYSIVAEAVGVSPQHVSNVVKRVYTSRRVATAIALALGLSLEEVFPEYEGMPARVKQSERKKTVESLKKKIAKAN